MAQRLAVISIDLDEIPCYCAIHGLEAPPAEARWAVYDRAVPRFEALLSERGLPATFFVIGRDAEEPRVAERLGVLHAAGHELGNHTYDHDYHFSRLPKPAMLDQVVKANHVLERLCGKRPAGFRAPGYTASKTVFEVLREADMAYDSSLFPCPAYYSAKAAAIGWIGLRGRRSHSILDTPRTLTAPADPYRISEEYVRRGDGLLELPIGVTRDATGRLPYIGMALSFAGPRGARWLTRAVVGRPLVNLELHGIDLACAEQDELGFLAAHQHDLRRSLATRRAALCAALDGLQDAGYRFVTLREAAEAFAART